MAKAFKWSISFIVLLVILAIIGVVIFVNMFNINDFKATISQQFYKQTGHKLELNGKITVSYFPWLGAKINNVAIGNPQGFKSKYLAKIGQADIKFQIMPLFSGRLVADKLILKNAEFNLVKNTQGQENWILVKTSKINNTTVKAKAPVVAATLSESSVKATTTSSSPIAYAVQKSKQQHAAKWDINISNIDIANANVSWNDQQTQQHYVLKDFSFKSQNIQLNRPFNIDSSFTVVSQKPNINGKIHIEASIMVLQDLKQIMLDNLTLQTDLKGNDVPNKNLHLQLATSMELNLNAQRFDLKYLNIESKPLMLHNAHGFILFSRHMTAQPVAIHSKYDALRQLGMNGEFTVPSMQVGNLKIKTLRTQVKADNGVLNIPSLTAQIFNGNIKASAQYNVQTNVPKITLNESIQGLQAGPMLAVVGLQVNTISHGIKSSKMFQKLWQNFTDSVTGNAKLNAHLTMSGKTDVEMRKSLQGSLAFAFKDGAIRGVDLDYFIALGQALIKGQTPPQHSGLVQTNFGLMQGNFAIHNGVASSKDLLLQSPLLKITGEGSANLNNESLDFALDATKMNSKMENGKEVSKATSLQVPLRLSGSFSKPQLQPNVKSILVKQTTRQLEHFKNKVVKSLTGTSSNVGKNLKKQINSLFN